MFPILRVSFLSLALFISALLTAQGLPAFDATTAPPAPDYSQLHHWAALPDMGGASELLPRGITSTPDSLREADVFFIHPTTYLKGNTWNAALDDETINLSVDNRPIKFQCTAWNGSCRVYAPRYRQAILGAFFDTKGDGERALDLAYTDVKAAFLYYLAHYNHGRPIVIASHSQGTYHARRLMKEFFDNKPLQSRLVCAYLIGFAVNGNEYHSLLPCETPERTGCIISWATYRDGYEPPHINEFYGHTICINPISWRSDTTAVPADTHRGMILKNFHRLMPARVSTRIHEHILWATVQFPFARHFDNLHIADINLFWMDIREDVHRRIGYFWKR